MAGNSLDVVVNFTMNGGDALNEFTKIKSTITSTTTSASKDFSSLNVNAQKSGNGIKQAFTNGLSGVQEKVRGISESFSGLNGVLSSVMGTIGLGSFKSMTLDMAMTRDQAKNLLAVTMQGEQSFEQASATADKFINKIKDGTRDSVVKLQMMIEAMNGIKLSTGMANSDLESLNDVIRKVGEASLLMGDDTDHATFVMKEAMSGLNGDFQVLKEQFGITADKMKAAGWSGAADDVQGYRQALEQCLSGLGDMGQVMDTTSGKINKIKSNFSSAGLEIGNQMLPAVDSVASAFLDANENGNLLAKGILYAGGAASLFASLAPSLKPMFDTYDSIRGAIDKAKGATDTLVSATETMDSITATLTATKEAETIATEANAVAEASDTVAKGADTVATEADTAAHITLTEAMAAAASSALALTATLLLNPWTWVAIAVIVLVAAMWHLYNTNEDVRNAFNSLWGMIKGPLMGAWNALSGAVNTFINALVPAVLAIIDFVKWIILLVTDFPKAQQQFRDFVNNGINYLIDGLMNFGGQIGSAISGVIDSMVQAGADMVDGFMKELGNLGNRIMRTLSEIPGIISSALSSLGDSIVPGGGLTAGIMAILLPLPTLVFGVFQRLAPTVMPAVQAFLGQIISSFSNIANDVLNAFISIPTKLGAFFMNAITIIQTSLAQAQLIANMIISLLVQGIVTRFNALVANVRLIFNFIVNAIMTRLNQAKTIAGNIAGMIRNTIVTRFNAIIAKASQIFQKIVNTIRSRLQNAVNQAKTKAKAIYDGIKNKVSQIPEMVKNEFDKIKDKIINALNNAKNAAVSKISELVAAVKSALGIASPGFIQRMFTYEFTSIPKIISTEGATAIREAGNMATGIVTAWNNNFGNGLNVPFGKISGQVLSPNIINTDAFNPGNNEWDMNILGNDLKQSGMISNTSNVQHSTIVHETVQKGDSKTIIIEHMENRMEMANLTKQESRRVLYDALDGLYGGGV